MNKKYQSTTEGNWIEILPVELTKEQKQLLMSRKEEDKEAQKELRDLIKSQREGDVLEAKVTELNAFYESKKPELKETDKYQLIAFDCSEHGDSYRGILNCRVNGEHIQVRF